MKKTYIIIILLAILSVITLYLVKMSFRKNENNGFVRTFRHQQFTLKHIRELNNGSFSFLRSSDSGFYFSSSFEQTSLYKTNYELSKIDTIDLLFSKTKKDKNTQIEKDVFNNTFFGINAYGDMEAYRAGQTNYYRLNGLQVDRLKVLSDKSLLTRTIKSKDGRGKRWFAKLKLSDSSNIIVDKEYALTDRTDNYFSNDGFFYYDTENGRILYLYYYHGEFLSLDSNLNLKYTSKTIDTVKQAKILTKSYKFGGKHEKNNDPITFATPPNYINIFLTTWKNNIYVISKLRADNEPTDISDTKQAIDVYDSQSGSYKYSFYVPKYKGLKLRQILIRKNLLVAIFKSYMVSYSFK